MDLTTQCPQCGTTFRATLEQLQLRKGYIRCVQCSHIFDGYEAVVPEGSATSRPSEPSLPPLTSSATPSKTPSAATSSPAATSPAVALPPETPPSRVPSVVRARREFTISDRHAHELPGSEPSLSVSDIMKRGPNPERHPSNEPKIGDLEAAHVKVESRPRSEPVRHPGIRREHDGTSLRRWQGIITAAWLVVIVVGVLILAAQFIYVFRVQLAENVPATRPGLERMCAMLNCKVAYSRQPDMIVFTQSSLQKDSSADDDNVDDDTLLLQLTLRNAYDKPQEWPTLVLELKDFSGTSIARKNLPKDVYLPPDVASRPFPASSEENITLPLKMQGLKVNGYQLTAFFP